ncbi:hypothetical protein DIPPA_02504 [Diplonema papillatum]|nr:hypothetical protein DIPPA_02504 [Diplonema papillatum]
MMDTNDILVAQPAGPTEEEQQDRLDAVEETVKTCNMKGVACAKRGDFKEGQHWLEKARLICETEEVFVQTDAARRCRAKLRVTTLVNAASLFKRTDKNPQALRCLEDAIDLECLLYHTASPTTLSYHAGCLLALGRPDEAAASCRRAIQCLQHAPRDETAADASLAARQWLLVYAFHNLALAQHASRDEPEHAPATAAQAASLGATFLGASHPLAAACAATQAAIAAHAPAPPPALHDFPFHPGSGGWPEAPRSDASLGFGSRFRSFAAHTDPSVCAEFDNNGEDPDATASVSTAGGGFLPDISQGTRSLGSVDAGGPDPVYGTARFGSGEPMTKREAVRREEAEADRRRLRRSAAEQQRPAGKTGKQRGGKQKAAAACTVEANGGGGLRPSPPARPRGLPPPNSVAAAPIALPRRVELHPRTFAEVKQELLVALRRTSAPCDHPQRQPPLLLPQQQPRPHAAGRGAAAPPETTQESSRRRFAKKRATRQAVVEREAADEERRRRELVAERRRVADDERKAFVVARLADIRKNVAARAVQTAYRVHAENRRTAEFAMRKQAYKQAAMLPLVTVVPGLVSHKFAVRWLGRTEGSRSLVKRTKGELDAIAGSVEKLQKAWRLVSAQAEARSRRARLAGLWAEKLREERLHYAAVTVQLLFRRARARALVRGLRLGIRTAGGGWQATHKGFAGNKLNDYVARVQAKNNVSAPAIQKSLVSHKFAVRWLGRTEGSRSLVKRTKGELDAIAGSVEKLQKAWRLVSAQAEARSRRARLAGLWAEKLREERLHYAAVTVQLLFRRARARALVRGLRLGIRTAGGGWQATHKGFAGNKLNDYVARVQAKNNVSAPAIQKSLVSHKFAVRWLGRTEGSRSLVKRTKGELDAIAGSVEKLQKAWRLVSAQAEARSRRARLAGLWAEKLREERLHYAAVTVQLLFRRARARALVRGLRLGIRTAAADALRGWWRARARRLRALARWRAAVAGHARAATRIQTAWRGYQGRLRAADCRLRRRIDNLRREEANAALRIQTRFRALLAKRRCQRRQDRRAVARLERAGRADVALAECEARSLASRDAAHGERILEEDRLRKLKLPDAMEFASRCHEGHLLVVQRTAERLIRTKYTPGPSIEELQHAWHLNFRRLQALVYFAQVMLSVHQLQRFFRAYRPQLTVEKRVAHQMYKIDAHNAALKEQRHQKELEIFATGNPKSATRRYRNTARDARLQLEDELVANADEHSRCSPLVIESGSGAGTEDQVKEAIEVRRQQVAYVYECTRCDSFSLEARQRAQLLFESELVARHLQVSPLGKHEREPSVLDKYLYMIVRPTTLVKCLPGICDEETRSLLS